MNLKIKMVLDSDGKIRPRQLPRTHAQNLEFFHGNYAKIDRGFGTPCWEWKCPGHQGYGFLRVNAKRTRAHRFSLLEHKGPPPPRKPLALHKCSNPPCVNPDHLYWGDMTDNTRDAHALGRKGGRSGIEHYKAKLTEKDVSDIRRIHARGKIGYRKLGKLFNVDRTSIKMIVKRKTWTHIP